MGAMLTLGVPFSQVSFYKNMPSLVCYTNIFVLPNLDVTETIYMISFPCTYLCYSLLRI